jgi:hypothetical protein
MMQDPIELLEFRTLLAANVIVTADSSLTAQIVGDKKNDAILITLSPSGGYLVRGLRGTTVNGSPAVTINTPSALNITIDMGRGNDRIILDGSAAAGGAFSTQALSIDSGDGNDVVTLGGTTHFGDITSATGKGNDSVTLDSVDGKQGLSITTGKGNDGVTILSASQIDGNSAIDTGAGKNRLTGEASLNVAGSNTVLGIAAAKKKHRDTSHHDTNGANDGN